jgi:hypothetical protein
MVLNVEQFINQTLKLQFPVPIQRDTSQQYYIQVQVAKDTGTGKEANELSHLLFTACKIILGELSS